MTIYIGSRYEEDVIDRVEVEDTFVPAIYHDQPPLLQTFDYSVYVTAYGDRLDALADRFYSDSEQWWIIANANPQVFYPDQIPVGTVLRIPNAVVLG